ncbi:hypothetical protein BDM02DRAFT_3126235 [Thelephora ganbajun]|uniref:Uncharacterized protein n=1 Tax=Thelephora ganbajun TaxID=370292 RepID=A0ACB6ZT94_THEGA|nr:hypothetical protein BDM02DRAFT_3126235 [Thelephora ganbajun]
MSEIPALAAGFLSLIGGVIGFARKRSVPSLIGGLSVGGLYIWSGLALQNGQPYGLEGALGSSILLFLSSAPRFPKGSVPKILALASASATVYYGLAYLDEV